MSQAFFTLIHRGEIFCLTSSWALVALGNAACYTNHCSNFSPWHNSSPVCQKAPVELLFCFLCPFVPETSFWLGGQSSSQPSLGLSIREMQRHRWASSGSGDALRQCLQVNGSWKTPAASCPIVWEGLSVPSLQRTKDAQEH